MPLLKVNQIASYSGNTLTVGTTGDTVTLATGATSSGFGATYNGAVNWSTTVRTTNFTAVSGIGYFINTTAGAVTVTLPATPTAGAIVAITDYAGTWATNNITISRNGSNIEGLALNTVISTNRDSITLVYADSTQGWLAITDNTGAIQIPKYVTATGGTVLTCGNYKTHVFTGTGCFVVSCAGNSIGSNSVEYLVVAGGGGGQRSAGGGGGAGGYRQNYPSPSTTGVPVTATTYPITVGAGGTAGNPGGPSCGVTKGGNSIFSTITSAGGGTGFGGGGGAPGGSGGGADTSPTNVGTGNTPPVSPPQGNPGGIAAPFSPSPSGGTAGGGGGAGASGTNAPNPLQSGPGGIGSPIAAAFFGPTSPSYGTPGPAPGRYFAGGGGGGTYIAASPGSGGEGGGGAGTKGGPGVGTTNTGGGGGGGNHPGGAENAGGAGGSGIVVIRYKYQ